MSERPNFAHHAAPLALDRGDMRLARLVYRHVPWHANQRVTKTRLVDALCRGTRERNKAMDLLRGMQELRMVECTDNGHLKRTSEVRLVEEDLYGPMKSEILTVWSTQPGHNYYPEPQRFVQVFENTGGDGHWERPDLTLIGGKTLPFIPGKFLDVITFEVKFWEDALRGLYEALAHRRRATHSYLVFFPPNRSKVPGKKRSRPEPWVSWKSDGPELWRPREADKKKLHKITDEARRANLGVIFATQEDDCSTWEELVKPIRHSPDPELLHEFVLSLIRPNDGKERYKERSALRNWLEASSFGDLTDSQLKALKLRPELREVANEFYREIPSRSEMERGLTCPEVPTLANRLGIGSSAGEEIFAALYAASHVDTRTGRGRSGVFKTGS